ncbi:MAG: alpha/beta fold hydrolase [Chloroflexota bacterium]
MKILEQNNENTITISTTASQLVSFANQELPATALAEIDAETPLLEFGILDSLAMVSLLTFVETQFGVKVPDEAVVPEHFETLTAMAMLVDDLNEEKDEAHNSTESNPMVDAVRLLEASGIERQTTAVGLGEEMHTLHVSGAQPTWVLLPGLGNPSSSWGTVLQSLMDDTEAIAVDFAGFGLSSSLKERPTHEDHLQATMSLLESLNKGPYVLVGSSAGSMIATEIARQRPDWVHALVITGFGLIQDVHGWWARLQELSKTPEEFLDAAYYRAPQLTGTLQRLIDVTLSSPAYQSFLEDDGLAAMRTTFDDLEIPTLFVNGQSDTIIPAEAVAAAAEHVPHAKLEWLARCGHFPPAEQPEELIYVIRNFLKAIE